MILLRKPFRRRKGRFSYLLAVMVVQLLLSPWAEVSGARGRITGLLAAGAVLCALYAVSENQKVWIAGVILAVPAFFHRIAAPDLHSFFSLAGLAASIAFDMLITVFVLQEILRHDDISGQTINGALCAYLTSGYAFGHLYMLLVHLYPDSFAVDSRLFHHTIAAQADLIYYSFTTLVALGANGIAPSAASTRCLSMTEGILGVLYLTVLLGRLVGLHVSQSIMKASQKSTNGSGIGERNQVCDARLR
jgi:voltage-gated potassium channel